jgi:hypothetical protein
MRRITIPLAVVQHAVAVEGPGAAVEFAVKVNWPELQLTENQQMANTLARVSGSPEPFPDHSIFSVVIPRWPCGTPLAETRCDTCGARIDPDDAPYSPTLCARCLTAPAVSLEDPCDE